MQKKQNYTRYSQYESPEYAQKMIDKGFQFVTIMSDQRFISSGAKLAIRQS